jgi:hypothetical protein
MASGTAMDGVTAIIARTMAMIRAHVVELSIEKRRVLVIE